MPFCTEFSRLSSTESPVVRLDKLAVGVEQLGKLLHRVLHPTGGHAEAELLEVRGRSLGKEVEVL